MRIARAHLPALPPSATYFYEKVIEAIVIDLIKWIKLLHEGLIREGLGAEASRAFRHTTVQNMQRGVWLKDSTGYEVLLQYWTDDIGRREFVVFAMHGAIPEPLEANTLSLLVLEGERDIPLFIHSWRPGPNEGISDEWRLAEGEALKLHPGFPLQKWLEAIKSELDDPLSP